MGRSKTGKKRPTRAKGIVQAAVQEVLENKCSIRSSDDNYGAAKSAIARYVAEYGATFTYIKSQNFHN
jgi:hypothetical protein